MLVRLAAVVTAMICLWMLAVPDFDAGPRPQANENAAIATLQSIHTAQRRFVDARAIDRDGDGKGEAGFFGELAAAAPVRGGERLGKPMLPSVFGQLKQGRAHRSGYWFELYLPVGDGSWVVEGLATEPDADASERDWAVCAWPDGSDDHDRRAFLLDGQGRVWACGNGDRRYLGTGCPLPVDAGMPSSAAGRSGSSERQRVGRDGQQWVRVR